MFAALERVAGSFRHLLAKNHPGVPSHTYAGGSGDVRSFRNSWLEPACQWGPPRDKGRAKFLVLSATSKRTTRGVLCVVTTHFFDSVANWQCRSQPRRVQSLTHCATNLWYYCKGKATLDLLTYAVPDAGSQAVTMRAKVPALRARMRHDGASTPCRQPPWLCRRQLDLWRVSR